MKKVVVGLSGGVDSSVAAYMLKEQGYQVIGMYMQNWHDTTGTLSGDCPWRDDRMFAELVAKKLDISFHFIDLSGPYRQRVVDYMFTEYGRGRTPNPDVLCNREIKFDAFLQEALKLGADYVATGHYCRREEAMVDGKPVYRLLAGSDPNKDQSYFLCQLSQQQLSRALFPIGEMLKPEVRRIAAEQGLATAERKDSQGICFVGKVDLPVFLQQKLRAEKGDIIEIPADWPGYLYDEAFAEEDEELERTYAGPLSDDSDSAEGTDSSIHTPVKTSGAGSSSVSVCDESLSEKTLRYFSAPYTYTPQDGLKVGEHNGAHFFTIGQRKGINVGGKPEPLFVISTDVQRNILYVGQGESHMGLYRQELRIRPEEMHWVNPTRKLQPGQCRRFSFRIRYRQPLQGGVLHVTEHGSYIIFDSPQRGVTAGQFAAWYDQDELVGSGVIDR